MTIDYMISPASLWLATGLMAWFYLGTCLISQQSAHITSSQKSTRQWAKVCWPPGMSSLITLTLLAVGAVLRSISQVITRRGFASTYSVTRPMSGKSRMDYLYQRCWGWTPWVSDGLRH